MSQMITIPRTEFNFLVEEIVKLQNVIRNNIKGFDLITQLASEDGVAEETTLVDAIIIANREKANALEVVSLV